MTFKKLVNVVEVVALVAAAAFVLALFVNEPDSGGGTASPGQAVYEANCARCHGADGGGGVGPQLSDGTVVEEFPDAADEVAVVADGKGGMPSFDGDLSPEEIDQVVEYTRTGLGG
jgi:mono/diheme cytochrome c family protein